MVEMKLNVWTSLVKKLEFSHPPQGFEYDKEIKDEMIYLVIPSPEGQLTCKRWSWIIKGWSKELGYHCWVNEKTYFESAYEPLEDQSTDWLALYEVNVTIEKSNKETSGRNY